MSDDIEEPTVKYFDTTPTLAIPNESWLVSFPYGAEDYGRDANGISYASLMITIFDDDGIATSISYRNGYVKLGYNIEEDKYFIVERRP